jgi:uncharacterized protein (DUF1330 family)
MEYGLNRCVMLYYTQLIYIQKGREAVFHDFEDRVLPLLERHGGKLIYRVRPDEKSVITCEGELPYEVHLVAFQDRKGFEAYRDDPARLKHMQLKDESVERILLIEGRAL